MENEQSFLTFKFHFDQSQPPGTIRLEFLNRFCRNLNILLNEVVNSSGDSEATPGTLIRIVPGSTGVETFPDNRVAGSERSLELLAETLRGYEQGQLSEDSKEAIRVNKILVDTTKAGASVDILDIDKNRILFVDQETVQRYVPQQEDGEGSDNIRSEIVHYSKSHWDTNKITVTLADDSKLTVRFKEAQLEEVTTPRKQVSWLRTKRIEGSNERSLLSISSLESDDISTELTEPISRLRSLARLTQNWDNLGATTISPDVIARAERLLRIISNHKSESTQQTANIPTPTPVPWNDGSVALTYDNDTLDYDIIIKPQNGAILLVETPDSDCQEYNYDQKLEWASIEKLRQILGEHHE